jgi:hypothetical protein
VSGSSPNACTRGRVFSQLAQLYDAGQGMEWQRLGRPGHSQSRRWQLADRRLVQRGHLLHGRGAIRRSAVE